MTLDRSRLNKRATSVSPDPVHEWEAEDLVRVVDTVRCGVTKRNDSFTRPRRPLEIVRNVNNNNNNTNHSTTAKNTNLNRGKPRLKDGSLRLFADQSRHSNTLPTTPKTTRYDTNHNSSRPFSYTNSQRTVPDVETIRGLSPTRKNNNYDHHHDFSAKIIITDDYEDDYETFHVDRRTIKVADSKYEVADSNFKVADSKYKVGDSNMAVSSVGVQTDHRPSRPRAKRSNPQLLNSATLVREANRGFSRRYDPDLPRSESPTKIVASRRPVSASVVPLLSDTEFEFEFERDPLAKVRRQVAELDIRTHPTRHDSEESDVGDLSVGVGDLTPITLDQVEEVAIKYENSKSSLPVDRKPTGGEPGVIGGESGTNTNRRRRKKKIIKFFHTKQPAEDSLEEQEERMKKFAEYKGEPWDEPAAGATHGSSHGHSHRSTHESSNVKQKGKHPARTRPKREAPPTAATTAATTTTTTSTKSKDSRKLKSSNSFISPSQTQKLKPRYFGESDQEEVGIFRSLPNRSALKKRNINTATTATGNRARRSASSSRGCSSESDRETKASNGSNRSVYLHAPTVADIPVRERERERDALAHRRKVTRSFSLLSPWKPKERGKEREIEYDSKTALPPRPPRKQVENQKNFQKSSKLTNWLKKRRSKEAKGI